MTRISIALTVVLGILASTDTAVAQYRTQPPAAYVIGAQAIDAPQGDPTRTPSSFISRTLLAGVGGTAGFIALGYVAFAAKGGPEGCDLCWETTVAAFVGSSLGAAGATTLAGGDLKKGLAGAALGAAAGLAVIGFLDQVADPGEGTFVASYALAQSLLTAYFSGR